MKAPRNTEPYRYKGGRYDMILTDIERGLTDREIKAKYRFESLKDVRVYRLAVEGRLSGSGDQPRPEPKILEPEMLPAGDMSPRALAQLVFREAPRVPGWQERCPITDWDSFMATLREYTGEQSAHRIEKALTLGGGVLSSAKSCRSIGAETAAKISNKLGLNLYNAGLITVKSYEEVREEHAGYHHGLQPSGHNRAKRADAGRRKHRTAPRRGGKEQRDRKERPRDLTSEDDSRRGAPQDARVRRKLGQGKDERRDGGTEAAPVRADQDRLCRDARGTDRSVHCPVLPLALEVTGMAESKTPHEPAAGIVTAFPEARAAAARLSDEELRVRFDQILDRLDSMLAYCDRLTGARRE